MSRSCGPKNLLLLMLLTAPLARCYPGGAPIMACRDMFPSGHGARPQSSPPPYRVVVPRKKYEPNTTIKISLVATEGFFRGVLVQARRVGCHVNTTQVVGAFTLNDNQLETQHCLGQIHSAVTHKSNSEKRRKEIYWTPPVAPAGHVVIRATFVKDKDHFWTNVESEVLVDLQEMDTPECIATTVRPIPAFTQAPTKPGDEGQGDNNVLGQYSSSANKTFNLHVFIIYFNFLINFLYFVMFCS